MGQSDEKGGDGVASTVPPGSTLVAPNVARPLDVSALGTPPTITPGSTDPLRSTLPAAGGASSTTTELALRFIGRFELESSSSRCR
jgi:hypothetical protein